MDGPPADTSTGGPNKLPTCGQQIRVVIVWVPICCPLVGSLFGPPADTSTGGPNKLPTCGQQIRAVIVWVPICCPLVGSLFGSPAEVSAGGPSMINIAFIMPRRKSNT
ncbi:hypothetical protein Fot_50033 [Forsythia ovata]|uniref:Uncharacterized protein n=1 Tax=Forsythia ovata TaxID=205694 RepID=A0ABD1PXX9_9LAMI